MFYRLDSAYKLAINSVKSKKEESLNIAEGYYNTFNKYYPNSERTEEVSKMNEEMQTQLATIQYKKLIIYIMMDLKKTNAPVSTETYDRNIIDATTDNIYEAISVISKRAEQINTDIRRELVDKVRRICNLQ